MERTEIKINFTAKSLPMLIKSASFATIISMTTMALINALAPRHILKGCFREHTHREDKCSSPKSHNSEENTRLSL